jgi:hypothetical protein
MAALIASWMRGSSWGADGGRHGTSDRGCRARAGGRGQGGGHTRDSCARGRRGHRRRRDLTRGRRIRRSKVLQLVRPDIARQSLRPGHQPLVVPFAGRRARTHRCRVAGIDCRASGQWGMRGGPVRVGRERPQHWVVDAILIARRRGEQQATTPKVSEEVVPGGVERTQAIRVPKGAVVGRQDRVAHHQAADRSEVRDSARRIRPLGFGEVGVDRRVVDRRRAGSFIQDGGRAGDRDIQGERRVDDIHFARAGDGSTTAAVLHRALIGAGVPSL